MIDGGGDIVATSPSSMFSLLHATQPMIPIGTHLADTTGTREGETRGVAVDFALGCRSSDGRRRWVGRGKWAVAELNKEELQHVHLSPARSITSIRCR